MPSVSEKRIFRIIETLSVVANHQSTTDWLGIFDEIAKLVSSGPGGLSLISRESEKYNLIAGTIDPDAIRKYNDHYQYVSPFRDRLKSTRVGSRFSRAFSLPDSDFVRSEIYQELYRPQDVFHIDYWPLFETCNVVGSIALSRSRHQLNFSADEVRALSMIAPHLARAMVVYLAFAEVRDERISVAAALNNLRHSALIIDRTCRIKFANDSAIDLLDAKDGIETRKGGVLAPSSTNDEKRFSAIIRDFFSNSTGRVSRQGGAMLLSRPNSNRPLQVVITPLSESDRTQFSTDELAMILIHDPDKMTATDEHVAMELFGLTAAESRFASLLVTGISLSEACSELAITENTGRTHLKHIFSKTETNRQSELLRLLMNLPSRRHLDRVN